MSIDPFDSLIEVNNSSKYVSTDEVLAVSCAVYRMRKGFIKCGNKSCFDPKSKKDFLSNFETILNHFIASRTNSVNVKSEDRELAKEIKDYFSGLIFKAVQRKLTDFEESVLGLVSNDQVEATVNNRFFSVCGVLPEIYYKNLDADKWAQEEQSLKSTAGPEGKLYHSDVFLGTIKHLRKMSRTKSTLVVILTDKGNLVKFFWDDYRVASVNLANFVKEGSRIEFSGRVYRQDVSKHSGVFENMVRNVSIISIDNPE